MVTSAVVGGSRIILKVWVVASLLGRDAAGGIIDQHHLQQVETLVVEILAQRLTVIASPLGERGLEIGI